MVLITKDSNLRIKADAIGVQAEDYTTDRVEMDELYTGHKYLGSGCRPGRRLYDGASARPGAPLEPNQFVTLVDRTNPSHTALARLMASERGSIGRSGAWRPPPGASRPRNREQQFAWTSCSMTRYRW